MNNQSQPNQAPQVKYYVILDTQVIQYAGHKERTLSDAVINILVGLIRRGYSLAISQITIFENLQNLWGDKAIKASKVLGVFEQKEVTRDVLLIASLLGGLYSVEGNHLKHIDIGDKIIAATAFLLGGQVLTRNHSDFPAPFFAQSEWLPTEYLKGDRKQVIDLALYRPNFTLISRRISELDR